MFIELILTSGRKIIARKDDIKTVKPYSPRDGQRGVQVELGGIAFYSVAETYDVFKKRLSMAYGYDWDHPEFLEEKSES